MNVLDSITKAPSQVLVKSATNFGQDAAKIIGAYAEECVKNSTQDIIDEIDKTTDKLCAVLKESLDGFGDTLHKTGVEAFTEWGIGIERAFLHLGQKLETGITNSTNRTAQALRDIVDESMQNFHKTIQSSSSVFAESISQFGLKHAEVYKYTFRNEILALTVCGFLISLSLCIFSIAAVTKIGLTGYLFTFILNNFVSICFLTFAIMNGYIIYASSKSNHARNSSIPSSPANRKKPRLTITTPSEETSTPLEISKAGQSIVPYLIVASIGYLGGNISTQIFTYTSINFLVSFIIMLIVTLLSYRILAFNLLIKVYGLFKHFQEFSEYMKEKREYEKQILENKDSIQPNIPDFFLEPDSAQSQDSANFDFQPDDSSLRRRFSRSDITK